MSEYVHAGPGLRHRERLAGYRQRAGARTGAALAAALNATVPLPLPLAPLVTVSHDVLLLTPVHAQPAGAVTPVEPVPPPATTDWLAGEIAYVQVCPACVTVNVCPAIVSVPVRGAACCGWPPR